MSIVCDSRVLALSFTPNGSSLVTRDQQFITRWDLADGEPAVRIAFESDLESTLAIHPGGSWVIASREVITGSTKAWDLRNGRSEGSVAGGYFLAFAPGGELFGMLKTQGGLGEYDVLSVVDFFVDHRQYELGCGETFRIKALTLTDDGRMDTVSTQLDGLEVRQWDLNAQLIGSRHIPDNLDFMNVKAAMTAEGRLVAYSASGRIGAGSTVRVVDTATQAELLRLADMPMLAPLTFSPDGTLFATPTTDSQVSVWRIGSGAVAAQVDGLESLCTAIAIDPANRQLAVGLRDGQVVVTPIPSV